jgi:hypothetical protein
LIIEELNRQDAKIAEEEQRDDRLEPLRVGDEIEELNRKFVEVLEKREFMRG